MAPFKTNNEAFVRFSKDLNSPLLFGNKIIFQSFYPRHLVKKGKITHHFLSLSVKVFLLKFEIHCSQNCMDTNLKDTSKASLSKQTTLVHFKSRKQAGTGAPVRCLPASNLHRLPSIQACTWVESEFFLFIVL